jgi:hypothetical protein
MRNKPPIAVHPCLTHLIDEKEEALIAFKQELSTFKPKMSLLELKITQGKDLNLIEKFSNILEQQRNQVMY